MARKSKLLQKALDNPQGLRFEELCRLAEQLGFQKDRSKGSHFIYTREGLPRPLNFQNFGGLAKPFQVKQLLNAARELNLIDDE